MATATEVLKVARGEIGYSRWKDPQRGTKYGRWYAGVMKSPYFGENGVPYCAMFVSWVFSQANAQAVGLPGAYCPTMLSSGFKALRAVSKYEAEPGDLVYFDWGNDGVTDHVGIVEKNCGTYLQTIEGNTSVGTSGSQDNGGVVARRTRSFYTISGVIRPNWDTTTTVNAVKAEKLDIDGVLGKISISELQRQVSTPVDGVVSGQYPEHKRFLPSLASVEYRRGGSLMVAALQAKVGAKTDGVLGPLTVKSLQLKLGGLDIDGYLGPATARALQKALNNRKVSGWR